MWKSHHDDNEPTDGDPAFAAPDGRRLTSINKSLNALLEAAGLKEDHRGKKRDAYGANALAGCSLFAPVDPYSAVFCSLQK